MNWRLDNPPVIDVSVSRHMGLFAVARLAERHGVRVRLRARSPHGLTALVWLPDSVIERTAQPVRRPAATASRPTSGYPGVRPPAGTGGGAPDPGRPVAGDRLESCARPGRHRPASRLVCSRARHGAHGNGAAGAGRPGTAATPGTGAGTGDGPAGRRRRRPGSTGGPRQAGSPDHRRTRARRHHHRRAARAGPAGEPPARVSGRRRRARRAGPAHGGAEARRLAATAISRTRPAAD